VEQPNQRCGIAMLRSSPGCSFLHPATWGDWAGKMVIPCHQSVSPAAVHKSPAGGAGSYGFLPPIHCKSVPGVISSNPCLWL
jgi:hypothetical protein